MNHNGHNSFNSLCWNAIALVLGLLKKCVYVYMCCVNQFVLFHLAIWHACLLAGGGSSTGRSGTDCKLGLTIVRPNSLQRLRRSATGQMAAYHVGTRG